MELRYDPRFTLEDISNQIDLIEDTARESDSLLIENETVAEVQGVLTRGVAYRASKLMTGARLHNERADYLREYEQYARLLGILALNVSYVTYDAVGDAHKMMKATGDYLNASKQAMVVEDYKQRLQGSFLERGKQGLAQRDRTRFVLPIALSSGAGGAGALVTAALLKSSEAATFQPIEFSPTLGGLATAATAASFLAVRSAVRSGSRQVGSMIGSQINASLLPYLERLEADENGEVSKDLEKLIGRYAVKHLEVHTDKLGKYFHDYELNQREDIDPMVKGALAVSAAETHKSYGIDPNNEWPGPWYLRIPSKILRTNLATS